ncbi:hypothetical protein ACB092_12G212700 [Castanea dentata]
MQNEEDDITELLDQSRKEGHKDYTQFDSRPCRYRLNKCSKCGAPVNDGGRFVARSEGHSSGPSQPDNEGGSGSRGTWSSWRDNGGGSGPRGPPNNCLSQFLANPRNLFLVFLFAFMLIFFLFLFLFVCLFVFLFYVK